MYGYSSSPSFPSADPVTIDLKRSEVRITFTGKYGSEKWSQAFPLHAIKRCTLCKSPVTIYAGGRVPKEAFDQPALLSRAWKDGFWRLLPDRSGFVLACGQHPYALNSGGYPHGTCAGTETDFTVLATLPATIPVVPSQPPRGTKPAPRHVRPPPPPPPPTEPVRPIKPGKQLTLF